MSQEIVQLPCPTRHFDLRLSPTPRGARLARLLGTEQLRAWGTAPDVTERAAHVIAELAANAVTHARLPGRDFRLDLHLTAEVLRIDITDTRPERAPEPRLPHATDESGRGLHLVAAFADHWGVAEGPQPRKTVWATIALPPGPGKPGAGGTGGNPQRTTGRKESEPSPTPPSRHRHSVG